MSRQALQSILVGYSERGKTKVLSPSTGNQFEIYQAEAHNRSGGTIDAGIGVRFADVAGAWSLGTITAASTPDFLDATTTIQAGSNVTIFTTTNNDGFLVQSKKRFNLIGLTIAQANTGSPTYVVSYYNGSAYTTLVTISAPTDYAVGTQVIVFAAPPDWAVGTTAAVGGSTTLYSIRVAATAAPSQAVIASAAWVAQLVKYNEGVVDNASSTFDTGTQEPILLEANEGIIGYFGSASTANTVRVLYKSRG